MYKEIAFKKALTYKFAMLSPARFSKFEDKKSKMSIMAMPF